MSGQILVNFATISQASSDVRGTANNIRQQLDDLEAGVKKIAASWEGAAQEGYQARQREWDQRAASCTRRSRPSPRRWTRPPRTTRPLRARTPVSGQADLASAQVRMAIG